MEKVKMRFAPLTSDEVIDLQSRIILYLTENAANSNISQQLKNITQTLNTQKAWRK